MIDKMEYTDLMLVMDNCLKTNASMIIYCDNGCVFKTGGNLGVFETDNGLEPDDEKYQEYYACIVKIAKIIKQPVKSGADNCCNSFEVGEGIEFSVLNQPLKIESLDGSLLWQND